MTIEKIHHKFPKARNFRMSIHQRLSMVIKNVDYMLLHVKETVDTKSSSEFKNLRVINSF